MTTTGLPYQTFAATTTVFVGADADIIARPSTSDWPHGVIIRDRDKHTILDLCLTPEAVADLYGVLAALMVDPDPAPWAARDLAHLAAGPDPLVVT